MTSSDLPIASLCPRSAEAGIRAGRVDEREHRTLEAIGQLHDPHGFPIALWVGHTEVAAELLLGRPALLVTDDRDRLAVEPREARHDRGVVRERAVPVQLEHVVEDPLDVVEHVGPVRMATELDLLPDVEVLVDVAREIDRALLEPGELVVEALLANAVEPELADAILELDDGFLEVQVGHAPRWYLHGPERASAEARATRRRSARRRPCRTRRRRPRSRGGSRWAGNSSR
jgi:hypothetical protein